MLVFEQKSIRLILTLLFISIICNVSAQDNFKPEISLYGFVRTDFFYDSYKGIESSMDQFYLVPFYTGVDDNGEHFNQQGSANFTAVSTRFGFNVLGPEMFGAKTKANIETDFLGISSRYPMLFRIRKAFVSFNWEQSNLLIGQNWHPFFGGADYPQLASLNTGAPFQPFNRSPQIRYDYQLGNFSFSGTLLYENQYVSRGFYSTPYDNQKTLPKRNAAIPEMVVGAKAKLNQFTIGAFGQLNTIQPIDRTTGTLGTFVSNELNISKAATAYLKFKNEKLMVLGKSVYGQNLANLTMLGGYGVASVNNETGAYTYTNYKHLTTFLNAVYGTKFQVGLLAATSKNLGTSSPLAIQKNAGLLLNVQSMYRLTYCFAYNIKNLKMALEFERTGAIIGVDQFNLTNGLYDSTVSATNNRILMVMVYSF